MPVFSYPGPLPWPTPPCTISASAEANPGFKSQEKWLSPDGKQIRVIYYFDDSASLKAFARGKVHQEAKARYAEWYDGYRVEIAEITASWGEGRITD